MSTVHVQLADEFAGLNIYIFEEMYNANILMICKQNELVSLFIFKITKNANPAAKVFTLDGAVTKHILQMYKGGPVLHCLGLQ